MLDRSCLSSDIYIQIFKIKIAFEYLYPSAYLHLIFSHCYRHPRGHLVPYLFCSNRLTVFIEEEAGGASLST